MDSEGVKQGWLEEAKMLPSHTQAWNERMD